MKTSFLIENNINLCDDSGYSILESLVGITIIGIISTLILMITIPLFSNPKLVLRKEAIILANNDINICQSSKMITDTSYSDNTQLLKLKRNVETNKQFSSVSLSVTHIKTGKILVSYNFICH